MSITSIGTLGSSNTKGSSGTLLMLVSATAEVGNLVVVGSVWDNENTTDGETSQLSISSSPNQTWVKVAEYTRSAGTANDGVCVALWYAVISSEIPSGNGITITSTTDRAAHVVGAWEFDISEANMAVETYGVNGLDTGDPPGVTLASMTSREYLLLHVGGEGRGSTWTKDADYTLMHDIETSGGQAATNVNMMMAYRIATLTGDTADAASSTDAINGEILAAIYEVAGGGGPAPRVIWVQG